eukprot:GFUD01008564.1.p1 GENE.GFUD01008564.1~~GFUD01008564.1.p1  ORF type:complete len:1055 (-),score=196.84 GFUD01008564.1:189-3353(-)
MGSRGWEGGAPTNPDKAKTSNFFRAASCVGEPQANAVKSMEGKDLRLFTDVVNNPDEEGRDAYPLPEEHWMNQELEGKNGKTLLIESISKHLHPYSEVLLKAGAMADLYSTELGVAPIHVAAQNGDLTAVKILVDEKNARSNNKADVNQVNKAGRTGLHIAAENKDVDIIDFLIKHKDIVIDAKDRKGNQTPLYLAVKNKSPQIVEMLVENGASTETICFGKPIQQHILEKMPGFDLASIKLKKAPVVRQDSSSVLERLAQIIDISAHKKASNGNYLQEFKGLVLQLDTKSLNVYRTSGFTLLQKCAAGNLAEFADVILNEGVDPNYCPDDSSSCPVHLAAFRGNTKVLKVLKKHHANFTIEKKSTEETVLHRLLLRDDAFKVEDVQECLKFMLSVDDDLFKIQIDKIINKRDLLGNTALHYATQRWPQSIVRILLERGANIGIKNQWGEIPINKILPSTMESFLDEFCLQSKNDVNHEEFEVTFKYNFLAPPIEILPSEVQGPYSDEEETEKISEKHARKKFALPETESLWYMGQSKEHRYLLRHPVITSFLWCKWTRIRRYVNRNMRFFMFFVMILTWFIFENFGGQKLKSSETGTIREFYGLFILFSIAMLCFILRDWVTDIKDIVRQEQIMADSGHDRHPSAISYFKLILSNWIEGVFIVALTVVLWLGASVLPYALMILLAGLAGREFFQMAVSLRRYFLTVENWIELSMIVLISVILFIPDEGNRDLKRHLAAISLFLSWAELITFVAKHPRLTRYNVYVTMFYKVFTSFFFFLLWYIFFIVAFGLGFYIMLHKDEVKTGNTTVVSEEDSGLQEFFNDPFLTFVKTSTMFVGELEFSDIPIDLKSPLMPISYAFFLAFVFLIVVVLMNLLNGLAVSDTGIIQEKAEIVAYLSRVETISYAESLLLGDPFDFLSNVPTLKWMMNIPSFSCCRQIYRNKVARRLFQRVTGAQGILLFYNFLPDKHLTIKPNSKSYNCIKVEKVGDEIIDAAKTIILRKQKEDGSGDTQQQVEERNKEIEQRFEEAADSNKILVKKVSDLEKKIDMLINKF